MSGRGGAASRDQAAFQWLLSREDEEDGGRQQRGGRRRSNGQPVRRRSGGREERAFIPGFRLREEEAGAGTAMPAQGSGSVAAGPSALASLQEAFAGVLPSEVIVDVLAACSGDAAAASEALLGMAGGEAAAREERPVEQPPPSPSPGAGAARGPCFIHLLPEEIKQLIFDQLSLR